jgi:hypothetical protein
MQENNFLFDYLSTKHIGLMCSSSSSSSNASAPADFSAAQWADLGWAGQAW